MRRRHASTAAADLAAGLTDFQAAYRAAQTSRFRPRLTGVAPMGSDADYHYDFGLKYFQMMEYFRHLDRDDPVIGQGVGRVVENAIQDGFKVDPKTGDEDLDKQLADRWAEWTGDPDACDAAGESDFNRTAELALRSTIIDGDVVLLPLRKEGALEAIEAHRLRTPNQTKKNVIHGVLLDGVRRRLQYWITKEDYGTRSAQIKVADVRKIDTRDRDGYRQVFHVYNPKRFSQTRGVSALAPIADLSGMHDDLQFANLVRAQVAACYAIFHEREVGVTPGAQTARGEQTTQTTSDGATRTIEGISPGLEYFGAPGESLKGFSPNVPNPEFFPHAMLLLSIIAVNLGLPVAVLLLDPTKTNFSGWRGAVDQARMGFRRIQRFMVARLHKPCYLWKLRQWIADSPELAGQVQALGPAIFRHGWNTPTWDYIEPEKDARADKLRLGAGLISPRRLQAERGRDWNDIASEIVQDRARLARLALEEANKINTEFDEAEIDWRELAGWEPPSGPTQNQEEDDAGAEEAAERRDQQRPAASGVAAT